MSASALVKTAAPGKTLSQKAKIMINKIPVAKSGEPAVIKPPIEMILSSILPSFNPAISPNTTAVGMEIKNARAARINELVIRRPITCDTGAL